MRQKTYLIAVTLILIFTACDKKDGDWEPMKWKSDSGILKKGSSTINVPKSGAIYKIWTTNYRSFWLQEIYEDGKQISPENHEHSIGEWSEIKVEDNMMIVTIQSNDGSNSSRILKVNLQAGNAFSSFKFEQE